MRHITNGDAVVPAIAEAIGIDQSSILVWRDVLHDGPVPAGLDPAALARVRAAHLANRGWADEASILADLSSRDAWLDSVLADEEIVLWFEDDLFDALQLAQILGRLTGRTEPVSRVKLRHPPRGDLLAAYRERTAVVPDGALFAAFRSPNPRSWLAHPELHRLVEELPDSLTCLSRLEQLILAVLDEHGPLTPESLYREVAAQEHEDQPCWLSDMPLWAVAEDLRPLVTENYRITELGQEVLAGRAKRTRPKRWIGGVNVECSRWAWNREHSKIIEVPF